MVWRWLRHHVTEGHAGNVVYGSIVVLALVLVLDHEGASARTAIVSIAGAVIVVAIAEAYAEVLQVMITGHRELRGSDRVDIAAGIAVHGVAAIMPIVFFVLAALDAMKLETAYTTARWFGVCVLGLYAFGAYRAAGVTVTRSLIAGGVLTLIGVVLVMLKSLVGH
ncbi:hypothetical protein [Conexibacter woesei]|uniref:Uncharacterized protein n=1 Tax=Conexibacter woesei (strain DSM 14684 / CCUG 47730 / CIP 108061 / JCM 11494 / NBRC 100937 / ID131577) TaxID=469383 RepID=D3FD00_CONWI|nr:hypothetical protein [Conexibacter woesei]ADB51512.1 hypothetical protein Cwoe_3093 [Conexibacter woesei DSM 14684]